MIFFLQRVFKDKKRVSKLKKPNLYVLSNVLSIINRIQLTEKRNETNLLCANYTQLLFSSKF